MTFVIAHRGASRAYPQNTVAAFRAAGEMGADAVELDVRPTADGHLVVHHDPVLADGRPVSALRRADLPDEVPDLAAALAACDGMWVNVEIKADVVDDRGWVGRDALATFVDSVVSAVEGSGDTERVLFSSFAGEVIDRCRQSGRDSVRTALLCHTVTADLVAMCVEGGHEAVHPLVDSLTSDAVAASHDHALAVNTWTCNDARRMDELIEWGVDGICTDVPDVLLSRLMELGEPPK